MLKSVKAVYIILALVSCLLLQACAISKKISGPNGEEMYSIDCSGTALNMGDCLEKAGKICGSGGYEIVLGNTANYGPAATANQYGFFMAPMISREIIIQCKKASASSGGGLAGDNATPSQKEFH